MSKGVLGIILGLAAGLAFGVGGVFVKPLLEAGWSPGAAVLARITVAALILAVPALIALKWDLRPLWKARWIVLLYGLVAVAAVQFFFYASLSRIPVSMTLLIEYLAPIALVGLVWVRTRRSPQGIVILGSLLALGGLVLVIGPGGGTLDPLGLLFAGIAMIGVCVYYTVGEKAGDLPPIALIAAGFVVGAIALGLVGATGLLPMEANFGEVAFLGGAAPWWVPLVVVGALSTAFAYFAGVTAIGLLGTRVAAFLGLSEVVFAAVAGWLLLGEALGALQLLGGALILAGIVCVRLERSRVPEQVDDSPAPAVELGAQPVPITAAIPIVTATSVVPSPGVDASAAPTEGRTPPTAEIPIVPNAAAALPTAAVRIAGA
ncbi:EamA family transporter [Agromyces seonyuensis]|uniref:EamA family transporter n=1 Tax=Agromyces seonyuensis TaxID=2662446 RepID=UPI003014D019